MGLLGLTRPEHSLTQAVETVRSALGVPTQNSELLAVGIKRSTELCGGVALDKHTQNSSRFP